MCRGPHCPVGQEVTRTGGEAYPHPLAGGGSGAIRFVSDGILLASPVVCEGPKRGRLGAV